MKSLINISLFLFLSFNLFAQADWEKWNKKEPDFIIKNDFRSRDYNFNADDPGELILKTFTNTYWFFISDADGDNCPFRPSCSAFFIEAVKETNVIQGSLMFFDRFTRDLNTFKKGKYPLVQSKHFHDPASLYTLSSKKINYISRREIVTPE